MKSLYERLRENEKSDMYPFHMPGHKRNMKGYPMESFYGIDITEIDGFDNLHEPQGILKKAMERAAKLYGAQETYFLVNGSTSGILTAVSSVLRRGQIVLMARNCHRAVYHAAYLNGLRVEYVYPSFLEDFGIQGGIRSRDIELLLTKNPDIKAVLITSPTYDGVVSDIKVIARLCHERGIPLVVDEAHGAHFPFHSKFPESALSCGADIVIHSVHKTLPALTQTALLHIQGALVDRERLRSFLRIYQSSSPSYILMAGIEQCLLLMEQERDKLFRAFFENLDCFRKRIGRLRHIKVLNEWASNDYERDCESFEGCGMKAFDAGKLVISVKGTSMSGKELYALLREKYRLQMEMAARDYVLAILTIMDTTEGFERLASALIETDAALEGRTETAVKDMIRTDTKMTLFEAMESSWVSMAVEQCAGRTAADFVTVYPPGIPVIVPGEVYTEELIGKIRRCRIEGLTILGLSQDTNEVRVTVE